MTREDEERIDRLLHDAEHADSGMVGAGMMNDFAAVAKYRRERGRLIAEAHALDPRHEADAWAECDGPRLPMPKPEP